MTIPFQLVQRIPHCNIKNILYYRYCIQLIFNPISLPALCPKLAEQVWAIGLSVYSTPSLLMTTTCMFNRFFFQFYPGSNPRILGGLVFMRLDLHSTYQLGSLIRYACRFRSDISTKSMALSSYRLPVFYILISFNVLLLPFSCLL